MQPKSEPRDYRALLDRSLKHTPCAIEIDRFSSRMQRLCFLSPSISPRDVRSRKLLIVPATHAERRRQEDEEEDGEL